MDSKTAIKVTDLTKIYKLYNRPQDRFKETFHPFRKKYHRDFHALHGLSFEIKKGDTVGIIGRNGAGKSTLLKLIYNVLAPTSGSVEVNGRTSALLQLGSGFNPEFTGVENVYFNGRIMGYSKAEMDEKIDEILSFADIGDFAYQPVKTYSTGMFVRLAFSVATMVEPEILILDEALSVGDIFFKAKCINRIKSMIDEKNVTFLFVSHDLMSVKSICSKAILLDNGKMIDYDDSEKVTEQFFSMKIQEGQQVISPGSQKTIDHTEHKVHDKNDKKYSAFTDNSLFLQKSSYQRTQNGKASIINVLLLNEDEEKVNIADYEQKLIMRMAIEIHEDMEKLDHGYAIRNETGVEIVHSDSIIEDKTLLNVRKGERYVIDWRFTAALSNVHGNYTLTTALLITVDYDVPLFEFCDDVPIAVQFQMKPRQWYPLLGLVHWDNKVDITKYDKNGTPGEIS